MPRKPKGHESVPSDVVRVHADLAEMIRFICLDGSKSQADYLSPIVREQVEQDYQRVIAARAKAKKPKPSLPPPQPDAD
jgi:hypothetical protein